MRLATLRKLVSDTGLLSFLRLGGTTRSLYRCSFATAAGASGVLQLLREGPQDGDTIARALGVAPQRREAMLAWLDCGVRAGELDLKRGRYHLKGRLSRLLSAPGNDVNAALFAEVALYHYESILQAPARLRDERAPYSLADQDGALIARSSRILEPFVEEAIDWAFEQEQPGRVLEVGCGAGRYLGYMLRRWPSVRLDAIDLQADVVATARAHLHRQGLLQDVQLRQADIFDLRPDSAQPGYALITLHNNLYYFDLARRQALLRHCAALLAPGGRLLITSSCTGGSAAVAALHLWWSLSESAAGLPDRDALLSQLSGEGWRDLQHRRLVPGESYHAFLARRPAEPMPLETP